MTEKFQVETVVTVILPSDDTIIPQLMLATGYARNAQRAGRKGDSDAAIMYGGLWSNAMDEVAKLNPAAANFFTRTMFNSSRFDRDSLFANTVRDKIEQLRL